MQILLASLLWRRISILYLRLSLLRFVNLWILEPIAVIIFTSDIFFSLLLFNCMMQWFVLLLSKCIIIKFIWQVKIFLSQWLLLLLLFCPQWLGSRILKYHYRLTVYLVWLFLVAAIFPVSTGTVVKRVKDERLLRSIVIASYNI